MNRIERFEPLNIERDPRKVCRCTINLGSGTYRCLRPAIHSGAHDAGVRHDDGFLVRW
jgi:hypothetical protein